MAAICRSAVLATARSITIRTKTVLPIPLSSRRAVTTFCRPLSSVLGGMESLRPLHSAIASARLISNIAVDTSYWSLVSEVIDWLKFSSLFPEMEGLLTSEVNHSEKEAVRAIYGQRSPIKQSQLLHDHPYESPPK